MSSMALIKAVQNTRPRINKELCEGLTSARLKTAPSQINRVLRTTFENSKVVQYLDWEYCTPNEQFNYTVRKRNNSRQFDHAVNDMIMLKLRFKFATGQIHEEPLLVPFSEKYNIIKVRGTRFVASPTWADNLFSLEGQTLFMPVTKNKIKFHRESYRFIADGEHWTADIHHSRLQNLERSNVPTNRQPLLLNYLLAAHGVTKTFKDLFKADITYGLGDEITEELYPKDKFVICTSFGKSPINRKVHQTLDVRLAVKIEDFARLDIQSVIAGFFYLTDCGSERNFLDIEQFENVELWKMSLVFFTWRSIDQELGQRQIQAHIETVNQYIDELVLLRLQKENLDVTNINELFIYIIQNFTDMSVHNIPCDTSDKYLHVTNTMIFDIVKMISELSFAVEKLSGDRLTENNIRNCFRDAFAYDRALKVVSTNKAAIATLDSPNECAFFKVTGVCNTANKMTGKGRSMDSNNPATVCHPSQAITHSYGLKSKASPAIGTRVNPFLELDAYDKVVIRKDQEEIYDNALELLGFPARKKTI